MRAFAFIVAVVLASACSPAAPGSKWATKLTPAPKDVTQEPPPPDDVYYLSLTSAELPEKTRGGQAWDDDGPPDPFAVLLVEGKETLRTASGADTLAPSWNDLGGNFELPVSAEVAIEVRDSDGVTSELMGKAKTGAPTSAQLVTGTMTLDLGDGGRVVLRAGPAHAYVGLGFDYGLDQRGLQVRKILKHSPASRAGLVVGDRIIKVGDRDVRGRPAREAESALNAIGSKPVVMVVQHDGGATEDIELTVGAIYPLYDELGAID
jgi:PDZ domain-containing protein/C2 domain-containing protein